MKEMTLYAMFSSMVRKMTPLGADHTIKQLVSLDTFFQNKGNLGSKDCLVFIGRKLVHITSFPALRNITPFQGCEIDSNNFILYESKSA